MEVYGSWLFENENVDMVSFMRSTTTVAAASVPTLAEALGTTPHLSILLNKARRLGMSVPDDLERLAIQRGCRYYAQASDTMRVEEPPADTHGAESRGDLADIDEHRFSPEELALALLTICLPKSQHRLRMGACMLSARNIDLEEVLRLSRQERAEPVLRHIAHCGRIVEPEEPFWRDLLARLPEVEAKPDVLPHITRFVAMRMVWRPVRKTVMQWIRPLVTEEKANVSV